MKEKVTITLPRELMAEVRAMAPVLGYSQFIAEAIKFFIEERRRDIREQLIEGYHANAEVDADLAASWSAVEDEAWMIYVLPYDGEEPAHDESS